MAEPDPIHDLRQVRSAYVKERRRVARQSIENAEANKDPHSSSLSLAAGLRGLQEMIELIDRAIDDETKIAKT
jgi:hypothetical protein